MVGLVCIAGIVLGVMHRRRAERPLTIMIGALAALLVVSLGDYLVEDVVYGTFGSLRGGGGIVDKLLGLWNWLAALLRAAATAGLIAAVLYDRGIELRLSTRKQPPGP